MIRIFGKTLRNYCGLLVLLILIMCCGVQAQGTPGQLISYQLVKTWQPRELNTLLQEGLQKNNTGIAGNEIISLGAARNEVDAYRIEYLTTNFDGKMITVTGMVLVPDVAKGKAPLLIYLHGAIFERYKSPSYPDACGETQAVAVIFAAHNYVVAMPDYIGMGGSKEMHPFLHARTEATDGRDMLRATRQLCLKINAELDSRLFITGFSQGGHATLALQRLLESENRDEFTVTASAPLAGTYDIAMCWTLWKEKPCIITSAIASMMILSYNRIYQVVPDLGAVFIAPFQQKAPVLLDGNHEGREIVATLPRDLTGLLQKDFLATVDGSENPFSAAMKENSVYDWRPTAPVKLYHSPADEIVPYRESTFTRDHMRKLGAKVDVVTLHNVETHIGSLLPALVSMKRWFDSMK